MPVTITKSNDAAMPDALGIAPALPKRLAMMIGRVCDSRRVRKLVAPNSPSEIAIEKAIPVVIAGRNSGISTRQNRLQGEAPRVAAAERNSGGIPCTTGKAARITNGIAIAA